MKTIKHIKELTNNIDNASSNNFDFVGCVQVLNANPSIYAECLEYWIQHQRYNIINRLQLEYTFQTK